MTVDRKGRYIDVDLIHKESQKRITFVSTHQLRDDYNANNEFLLQLEKILDERNVSDLSLFQDLFLLLLALRSMESLLMARLVWTFQN